jgi:hypothetical protein
LATFLRLDSATTLLRAVNNVLVGNMTVMIGESRWLDTLNNPVFASPDQVGFINPATYDYRITQSSILRGNAVGAGVATSTLENYRELPLTPVLVYVHPCQDRIRLGSSDVGAYEYDALTSMDDAREQPLNLYPNPAADIVSVADGVYDHTSSTQVIDITGRSVIDTRLSRFSVAHLPAGVYTVVRGAHVARLLVQR